VVGGIERTPLSREISRGLFERAQALAATLEVERMPERAALLAALLQDVLDRPRGSV
jgi:hypothetical protein